MLQGKDSSTERGIKIFLDLVALFLSANLAFDLRYGMDWGALGQWFKPGPAPWAALYQALPYLLLGWFVIFSLFGVYRSNQSRREELTQMLKAEVAAFVLMFATTFFYRGFSYSRGAALVLVPLALTSTLVFRGCFVVVKSRLMKLKSLRERFLLVGWTKDTSALVERIRRPDNPFELAGVLTREGLPPPEGVPALGTLTDLGRVLTREHFDRVVLVGGDLGRKDLAAAIDCCLRHRMAWSVLPDLYELFSDRLRLESVAGVPVLAPVGTNIVGLNRVAKRAVDLLASALLLLLFSPGMLLVALLVKLGSVGKVLYVQKRVGKDGREFKFYKFRTMIEGVRDREHREVMAQVIRDGKPPEQGQDEPVYKLKDDPRVTRLGRWLRRFSADELPQLLNVLKGDMSLVGPRPAIPYEVAMYSARHRRRLEVLPGITGLWQVSGRNKLPFEEMVTLDIQYLENWSLGLDLRIIFKTVLAVLFTRGY